MIVNCGPKDGMLLKKINTCETANEKSLHDVIYHNYNKLFKRLAKCIHNKILRTAFNKFDQLPLFNSMTLQDIDRQDSSQLPFI